MPRIVVNGRFLAQQRTGVQRYGIETLRALDRLLGQRPQLRQRTAWQLAIPHDARDVPLLDHFEIQTLQFLRGHAWEQVSLAAFARGAHLLNFSYSAPLLKRDQLITLHDAAVRAQPQTFSLGYRLLNGAMVSMLAERVQTLMTVSHFSADELRRHGLRRDDVVVGREGWEHVAGTPPPDEAALLRQHGLTPGAYLLAVGSAKASKNFGLIPQALRLLGEAARWPVVVAGACDTAIFQRSAGDAALRWLGFVPDDELQALYRHAAWFIFPSLYEGFGLPALEALANGCPVLAARAGATPEVCGDAVLYFDPHDPAALAQLLREVSREPGAAARRSALLQRAAARLSWYRWDANAEIVVDRLSAAGAVAPADDAPVAAPRFDAAPSVSATPR